jgi:hypothetical protein
MVNPVIFLHLHAAKIVILAATDTLIPYANIKIISNIFITLYKQC